MKYGVRFVWIFDLEACKPKIKTLRIAMGMETYAGMTVVLKYEIWYKLCADIQSEKPWTKTETFNIGCYCKIE